LRWLSSQAVALSTTATSQEQQQSAATPAINSRLR
jgi:hypothetical protein